MAGFFSSREIPFWMCSVSHKTETLELKEMLCTAHLMEQMMADMVVCIKGLLF